MKYILIAVAASNFLLAACGKKKDKDKTDATIQAEPNAVFLEACQSPSTPELQRNMVSLVLRHPLVATQDCVLAAKKVSMLKGIALGSADGTEPVKVSLEPLATLTNLRLLGFYSCQIADLAPIAALPLTSLFLSTNELENLESLRQMTSLESLTIYQNPVTSLAPLAQLPNLKTFAFEFLEGEPDLVLDEASCPITPGTNTRVRAECLVRRANGPLWLRSLVGEWEEGSQQNDGFRLDIDGSGRYVLIAYYKRDGRLVGRSETGHLKKDQDDTSAYFEPETFGCGAALTQRAGPKGQVGLGRQETLVLNLKAFGELTFKRTQVPLILEAEDCG